MLESILWVPDGEVIACKPGPLPVNVKIEQEKYLIQQNFVQNENDEEKTDLDDQIDISQTKSFPITSGEENILDIQEIDLAGSVDQNSAPEDQCILL